jgi:uncharacterized protein YbjT (DUF2867 family)
LAHNSNLTLKERTIMTSKLLIAGANGNIGRELTKILRASGTPFEAMSSKAGGGQRIASFESVPELTAAFAGVQHLFVVLPLVPHKLQLAHNVAQAAKAAGVQHIVRASGAGADPASPFALPRLQGEVDAVLAETGIATTFLRNAGFMQNYATFMAQMVKDGTLYLATNNAAQSLIDVRDIAAVAATVLRAPEKHVGRAYTLTGGEALTDDECIAAVQAVTGRSLQHVPVTVEESTAWMRDNWHMPEVMLSWMASLSQLVRDGYASSVSPDVQRLLGRAPIGFAQFARDHAKAWL